MSSIATVSVQNFPFASTKISCLRPSPQLKDVRKLTISSTKMQSKTLLIFCTLQGTNNKTKKNLISTLSSMSQKLLHDAINIISSPIQTPISPVDSSSHDFGGNFAPVEELEPTDCEVIEGEIPLSLNGVYIRNGPNLQHHQPRHLLDFFFGDGMLHSLQLSNGEAKYCGRYVKTYKYLLERDAGFPIVPSGTSLNKMANIFRFIMAIATKKFDVTKGSGVANTSLAFFANKLVAMCEYDLPYVINVTENGDIETSGRWEVDGNNPNILASMTAHPKVDSETKETFAFRWSLIFPHLTFFRFDENGVKQKEVPILSIKKPSFFHDFAITKRFAVFHDTQLLVAPLKVMAGKGTLVDYDPKKVPRVGIIPRNALNDSEMQWFEIPEFNTVHILNAWENGDDEIVLVGSNVVSMENIFDETSRIRLEKVTIDVKTKKYSRSRLSEKNLEFGSINPHYVGKKTRFGYLGINDQAMKMPGVVKIDLETGYEVGRRLFGPGCYGGEPFFVQRSFQNTTKSDDNEDDGYLMSFVHNEHTDESKFLLMDAKSPKLDVMAVIRLPRRVPYGFHGLFLNKD